MSTQIIEPTNLLTAQDAEDSYTTQVESWDAYRPLSFDGNRKCGAQHL